MVLYILGFVDFMNLGMLVAELMALCHATETLPRTVVMYCEIKSFEIYKGWEDISLRWTYSGFRLVGVPDQFYFYRNLNKNIEGVNQIVRNDGVFLRKTKIQERCAVKILTVLENFKNISTSRMLSERIH
ncbi:hypothetical protein [Magnetospirillum molischianum]|uniref:Uncharacterized protein n=1 Tax=Magnetospirillum molischianum DSM 120 TaxID=1150626 RepID=H8FUT1_MAGML|nr:hypothetical protein [Magnetospirillum molischianum]CCG42119.1 hypothetical protein PHAMO_330008 [Magnetospirillum molischianum DSM 120]